MAQQAWRIDEIEKGERVSHLLVFGEDIAYEREDLVTEAITFLGTLPGVTEVEHVEREFAEIVAHGVPV